MLIKKRSVDYLRTMVGSKAKLKDDTLKVIALYEEGGSPLIPLTHFLVLTNGFICPAPGTFSARPVFLHSTVKAINSPAPAARQIIPANSSNNSHFLFFFSLSPGNLPSFIAPGLRK